MKDKCGRLRKRERERHLWKGTDGMDIWLMHIIRSDCRGRWRWNVCLQETKTKKNNKVCVQHTLTYKPTHTSLQRNEDKTFWATFTLQATVFDLDFFRSDQIRPSWRSHSWIQVTCNLTSLGTHLYPETACMRTYTCSHESSALT